MQTQTLLPGLTDAILANVRQRIRDREVELRRHGNYNRNSHSLHLKVTHLSEIDDEAMLCEYLEHLNEVDR